LNEFFFVRAQEMGTKITCFPFVVRQVCLCHQLNKSQQRILGYLIFAALVLLLCLHQSDVITLRLH
jgi:hypothetical protein